MKNKKLLLKCVIFLVSLFSFSCVVNNRNKVVRGHISVGPAFEYITLSDKNSTCFVDRGSESVTIGDWIEKQPVRSNPFMGHYAGCRAVYVEALASENRMTLPMQGTYKVLRIEKIFKIEPPHSDFFGSQKHPLPQPL